MAKSSALTLRLTPEDHTLLRDAAWRARTSLCAYILAAALKAAQTETEEVKK